ncbi:hypothetical protein GCM10027578_39330 [Spirosoma luteolum]
MRHGYAVFLVGWLLAVPVRAQLPPKKLLIYYGYPSYINKTYDAGRAAAEYARYDYVVLGDGYQFDSHPDYAAMVSLLNSATTAGVRFFGYVDLGVTNGTQNRTPAELRDRIDRWKRAGIDGIFFDDFGYDHGVSRQRQNDAVAYAHAQGLPVVANGWNPDDVLGRQTNAAYNPTGVPPVLGAADCYLLESNLIAEGQFQDPAFWQSRADRTRAYQRSLGIRILSITTNNNANAYDAARFSYAWYGAFLYGHEATGWGEYAFAASTVECPYRDRPVVGTPGTRFLTEPARSGSESVRFTNAGRIRLNTTTHTGDFTPSSRCQANASGNWSNPALWSCGRVPFPCDPVQISAGQRITIDSPAQAQTLQLDGKIQYSIPAGQLQLYP